MAINLGGRSARRSRRKTQVDPVKLDIDVLDVNGRKFVAGMHWEPLNNSRKPLAEAKTVGARNGWDIVSIKRGGDWIQAGFVSRADGAYKGMFSIASALAVVLGTKWCGVFDVGNERYLVVAVDGTGRIVAASDRVHPAARAKQVFNRILSENKEIPAASTWAPAALELAASERSLADLLPAELPKAVTKASELLYLKFGLTREQYITMAAFVLLSFVAYYGFNWWDARQQEAQQQEDERQAAIRQKALDLANANARMKLEQSALAHPWATLPRAEDFINACETIVDRFPLSIAGWMFTHADCNGTTVIAEYTRAIGTSQDTFTQTLSEGLIHVADESSSPVLGFEQAGDKAKITLPLNAPAAGDEPLMSANTLTPEFLGPLQRANAPEQDVFSAISIIEVPVVITMPPQPPGQPPLTPPQATWRQLGLSFKSQLQPKLILAGMKHQNGLRITDIDTILSDSDATLKWSIKGDFYVQR